MLPGQLCGRSPLSSLCSTCIKELLPGHAAVQGTGVGAAGGCSHHGCAAEHTLHLSVQWNAHPMLKLRLWACAKLMR